MLSPTEHGTGCPKKNEYLLCKEDSSITVDRCKKECEGDAKCVGFMVSHNYKIKGGRCELHSKAIDSVADPLQCYGYNGNAFSLLGYGPCRTKEKTKGGAKAGTYYGNMK